MARQLAPTTAANGRRWRQFGVPASCSILVAAVCLGAACSDADDADRSSSAPSTAPECRQVADCTLREVAAGAELRIGTAVDPAHLEADERYRSVLSEEFNSLTPENAMKWPLIHPEPDRYDFADSDRLVEFARANGMEVRGHTLVWGQAVGNGVADYLKVISDPEALRDSLVEHISTVVGRYRGEVDRWDVVNEPLQSTGDQLDDNLFRRLLGDDYIAESFRLAHEADPDAELWLNEVTLELFPAKAEAFVSLVADLVERDVPLHGVGLQTHLFGGAPAPAAFEALVQRLADLGLELAITEMDLPAGPGADRLEQQADGYAATIGACLAVAACREVTFWGFTDRYTWLDGFLGPGTDPLLFDADYARKPAYEAVRDALATRR
jgi:endo-1,4-beta-xylanase